MGDDSQGGEVVPFPSRGWRRSRIGSISESWLRSQPSFAKLANALATPASELDPPRRDAKPSDESSTDDLWRAQSVRIGELSAADQLAYADEAAFRRRFRFNADQDERGRLLLFKQKTGLTDGQVALLGRTRNWRFEPAVGIRATRLEAVLGYGLVGVASIMMSYGLLTVMNSNARSLFSALALVTYESVFLGFAIAFHGIYVRPYQLRRRVERLLRSRANPGFYAYSTN